MRNYWRWRKIGKKIIGINSKNFIGTQILDF